MPGSFAAATWALQGFAEVGDCVRLVISGRMKQVRAHLEAPGEHPWGWQRLYSIIQGCTGSVPRLVERLDLGLLVSWRSLW